MKAKTGWVLITLVAAGLLAALTSYRAIAAETAGWQGPPQRLAQPGLGRESRQSPDG